MADLRIVGAPVLLQESITDDVKMPTGGLGNFSIRLGDIVWYVVNKEQLASKSYVDLSSKGVQDKLDTHVSAKDNPHQVTKSQVGLGNVDNTADIDKPVSNAVNSAIITATNDMATKAYVNSKDGDLTTLTTTNKTNLVKAINEVVSVKADKATTLVGYGISDAYTKSEIDTNYGGVKTLYDKNVAAGAGANGWTDLLVNNIDAKPLRTVIVEQVESIADLANIAKVNKRTVIVKSYHAPNYALAKPFDGGGTFVYDASKDDINDGGMVIDGWVRQADDVKVEYFGAFGDGVTDDYQAIQTAAIYCAKNSKALLFGDSVYVCNSKVVIDSAVTYFKTVRLIGTYRGTGSAAGYAPNIANSGTTILVNDNDFIEVQIKRWYNENIILDGFALVNTAATVARSAIKLSKGDFANYPEENRYITNNMFNNIATHGFERSVVFSGNYTKAMAGTSYLWNYFGPTELNNFYPYNGKNAIVLENATLNRLVVNRALFFNLSGGAIVTTEKDANSHESVLMCQLNFVHFEDCRGMFRLGMGTAPSDGAKNHITMIDVTREVCGMYGGKNGSPYGIVINTDLQIKGRHDIYGYLEQDMVIIGQGSTLHSDVNMLARVLPEGGKSLSPSKINVGSKKYVIASQSTKIIDLVVSNADKQFDLVVAVKINSSSKGFKEYRVVGQATGGTLRSITEIGSIDSNITIIPSSYNSNALELSIENRNGVSIEVDVVITHNYTGIQNYIT